MLEFLRFILRLAVDLLRSRAELVAENALLRQQLIVAQRRSWAVSDGPLGNV